MRTLFITALILSWQILFAQQKTEAYFGVSGRTDVGKDIIEMYDKGYYISGGFEGDPYHFGWNIKTGVNLEMLYDKVFEHSLCSVGNFVSVSDENGNIYIAGIAALSGGWPLLVKMDSCGNTIWCKVLQFENEFENGWTMDIIITINKEIVLLTYFDSDEEIETIHLTALSENGNVLWNRGYASKNDYPWINEAAGYSLEEINSEYYISGFCYWPYPDDTTHWFLRPLFIGIDSLFEEKWILPFAPLDSVFGDAFASMALNDSVIVGAGTRLSGDYNKNSILLFYDIYGNELGYTQFSNESIGSNIDFNAIRDIKRINDSLFLSPYYLGIGGETYFGEFVYDTSGIIFNNTVRGIYSGNSSIIKTSDNNFIIEVEVAESESDDIYIYKIDENLEMSPFDPTPYNYDSLCPGGIVSGTIDLTSCFVWTGIGDAPSPGEYYSFIKTIPIKTYPNPVTEGTITFEFKNTEHHNNMEISCFDIFGNEIYKEDLNKYQGKCLINVSQWCKGLYMLIIYSDNYPVGNCKFVVQ